MIETYLRQYEAQSASTAGLPAWLQQLRRSAIDGFQQAGFPTAKDEEWRFTPVAPIAGAEFAAASRAATVRAEDLEPFLFGHPEWTRLVFVNGQFAPELSSSPATEGLTATTLAVALAAEPEILERHLGQHVSPDATPFTALNTALSRDGALVRIAARAVIETPIHLVFVSTAEADGVAIHPRALVLVEREARAQLVESYVTLAPGARYWTNPVCEISMAEGSWIEHSRIQRESEAAYHTAFTQVNQWRDSHYRSFSLAMGSAIARHNLHTRLNAPNTEALLYGLSLAHGDQLIDNHTVVFHDQPDCRSWEVYKAILDGRSHGVFNGKIFVQPIAQKTDAKQTNRTLLLSDTAKIDTKPQLEIFADDVKCTHGATVGNLDPLSGFYLQSRGVPAEMARRIQTYAFAAEVLEEISSAPVRNALDILVHARLGTVR
ncbi:MAG: Fe-S cluster assembly protein SufD [Gemmatimonadales bacterium]|nr:Fe-S cluster assembly protein SufD [Gemmatimonadales bacterium]